MTAGGLRLIFAFLQCFLCSSCRVSMAGKGFITDGEDIICPECAREKLMGTGITSSG